MFYQALNVVLAEALAPAVQQAQEHVRNAPVVCADETGHREKNAAGWMWVAIAGMVSVFLAHASRSAEAARELLDAAFAGILVSDRYAAYECGILRNFSGWKLALLPGRCAAQFRP